MQRSPKLQIFVLIFSLATFLCGCGDDDDQREGDSNNNTNAPPLITYEELTAPNISYGANVAGRGPVEFRFPSSTSYQWIETNRIQNGSIIDPVSDASNSWTLRLHPAPGQEGSRAGVLNLTFTSSNEGVWTFTPDGGQAETGTFARESQPKPEPPDPIFANDLTGRILYFNYEGTGRDKFAFISSATHQWEDNLATGTYEYDAATGNIILEIPARGETLSATLVPGSTSGSTTVTIRTANNTQQYSATYILMHG